MDRPTVQRSSLPLWSQPYPHSAPQNRTYPPPFPAQYPPHDQHDPYPAPTLYPTVVSQQFPQVHRNSQPLPNTLIPGGPASRPRVKSTAGGNSYFEQPAPPFPSLVSPHFPQAHPFPHHLPSHPSNPPVFQPQSSGYQFPPPNQPHDEVPIRPSPMSARRSSSSPAINRIPAPDVPPPIPPLPPHYQSSNHQHTPQRLSPVPPPIPIPSPGHSYRSDSSPLYDSPFEAAAPPFSAPHQPHISSPPRFPTSSPPSFEGDVKRVPVDEEEEALAFAIALSEKESMERTGEVYQEEEDLAKAIEESVKHTSSYGISISSAGAGPSTFPKTTSPLSFPSPLPASEPSFPTHTYLASPNTSHFSASRPTSKVSSPLIHPVKSSVNDDEALAHQLAVEEAAAAETGPSSSKPHSPVLPNPKPETTRPPPPAPSSSSRRRQEPNQSKFTVVNVDSDLPPASRKHQEANQSKIDVGDSDSEPPPPLYHHVVSAQTSAPAKTSPTLPNKNAALGRSTSASVVTPSSSRLSPVPDPADQSHGGRSQSVDTLPISSSSTRLSPPTLTNPSSLASVEESSNSPPVQSPASPTGPVPANSFIDQKLLYGVCKFSPSCAEVRGIFNDANSFSFQALGFNPPQISTIKTTLMGGVPNVISLPTGRFMPFHIQAPDWRHLLKMMARLSGSRIEASVEALAANKQELKLRTVVQFIKVRTGPILRPFHF